MTQKDMQIVQEHYNDAHRELAPVRYGRWIDGLEVSGEMRKKRPFFFLANVKYCSACWNEAYWDTDYGQQLFDYCPYCGADMQKELQI